MSSIEMVSYYNSCVSQLDRVNLKLSCFISFFLATQSQLESLKCTICSCQLFLVNPENIRFHPALGVLICKVNLVSAFYTTRNKFVARLSRSSLQTF